MRKRKCYFKLLSAYVLIVLYTHRLSRVEKHATNIKKFLQTNKRAKAGSVSKNKVEVIQYLDF